MVGGGREAEILGMDVETVVKQTYACPPQAGGGDKVFCEVVAYVGETGVFVAVGDVAVVESRWFFLPVFLGDDYVFFGEEAV